MVRIWDVALLSWLCFLSGSGATRMTETDDVLADTDSALAVREDDGTNARALVPHDYWSFAKSGERCKAARRGRNVRRIFGAVVGVALAIPVAILGSLAYSSLYWTWYLTGAKSTVLFVSTHATAIGGIWATFMATKFGINLVHWTADMVSYLLGKDGHKPVCCCTMVTNNDTNDTSETPQKMCGMVGSGFGKRPQCPPDFNHEPDQCESVEPALTYSTKTSGGCECVDFATCEKNSYHRGHAWCKVKSSKGCDAHRYRYNPFRHWDYCDVASADIPGANITVNTFVSQFTINRDKAWYRLDPRYVWRFGSYVDTSKALVIAPVTMDGESKSACLPGEPEETLDGCAQKCVEDGAPIADEDGKADVKSLPCHAFAYNHHTRLCVRIPKDATGAEFRPFQRNPGHKNGHKDGWQNFIRKVPPQ